MVPATSESEISLKFTYAAVSSLRTSRLTGSLRTAPVPAGADTATGETAVAGAGETAVAGAGETAVTGAGLADRLWPGAAGLDVEVAAHPATATVASRPSQPSTRILTVIVRMLASESSRLPCRRRKLLVRCGGSGP